MNRRGYFPCVRDAEAAAGAGDKDGKRSPLGGSLVSDRQSDRCRGGISARMLPVMPGVICAICVAVSSPNTLSLGSEIEAKLRMLVQ